MFRCRFENIAQRRYERINAATQILEIDKDDIACIHHCVGRLAHLTIEAEYRNAMHRIDEVRRLNHVVLLVAAQTMLWPESRGDLQVAACC